MLNCLKSNSEWESCDSNERGQPEVVCLFGTLFCCCCAHDLHKSRAGGGGGGGSNLACTTATQATQMKVPDP